jgi:hypothetical protein
MGMRINLRFRFGMRTLAVVVTILCLVLGGWVTYQKRWIALRRAALATDGIQGNPSSEHDIYDLPYSPNWLWMFGEPGQSVIHVAADRVGDDRVPELRELFPEARFNIYQYQGRKRPARFPPMKQ